MDTIINHDTTWGVEANKLNANFTKLNYYHIVDGDDDLTSAAFWVAHPKIIIVSAVDLGGGNITTPAGVVIKFNGGKITNYGTITLNNTVIDFDGIYEIFDGSGTFAGVARLSQAFITPIHFGAKGDGETDDIDAFNAVSQFIGTTKISGYSSGRTNWPDPDQINGYEIFVPPASYLVTDSILCRGGQRWRGHKLGTYITFAPTSEKNLFDLSNVDTDRNYYNVRQGYIQIRGFDLCGDVDYEGAGNALNAIYLSEASYCDLVDISINKFDTGISVNFDEAAAYYNRIDRVDIDNCKRCAYVDTGTAVTVFRDCYLGGRVEFTAKYDYAIYSYNNLTFINCSIEGTSWPKGLIYSPTGKITILGGRVEGSMTLTVDGRGITGSSTMIVPNGPTTGFGEVLNIDDAPAYADAGIGQNSLGQNIYNGSGIAQEVKKIKNQNFKFGTTDWSIAGTGGYFNIVTAPADLMGASTGIKITKIDPEANYIYITKTFDHTEPQLYVSLWYKSSDDAIVSRQIHYLTSSDDETFIREFIFQVKVGDWYYAVAKIQHYDKRNGTHASKPYLNIGLKANTPAGEWVIFCNIRFWVGGYPLFSGSEGLEVDRILSLSTKPTMGIMRVGDIVYYDGTDESYPVGLNESPGCMCVFSLTTTASSGALAEAVVVSLTDVTGIAVSDIIGITQDGEDHWTTVAEINGSDITISHALTAAVTSGNRIHVFRMADMADLV